MPIKTIAGIQLVEFEIVSAEISGILSENLSYSIKCFYIMFVSTDQYKKIRYKQKKMQIVKTHRFNLCRA